VLFNGVVAEDFLSGFQGFYWLACKEKRRFSEGLKLWVMQKHGVEEFMFAVVLSEFRRSCRFVAVLGCIHPVGCLPSGFAFSPRFLTKSSAVR
jgi:hypothetical protein